MICINKRRAMEREGISLQTIEEILPSIVRARLSLADEFCGAAMKL
jgi:hypothetical protein